MLESLSFLVGGFASGVGMVTPLGCGVETTWKRLIEGECGVRAICADDLKMNGFEPEVNVYI